MIMGSKGVTLNYAIRDNDDPIFDPNVGYEENVVNAVSLSGPKFNVDAKTVHQIILKNVHEDSDAYTYIKTLLKHRNGRMDIKALKDRYSNDATKTTLINAAKASLETIRYKNERAFSFEKFSSKLQRA